MNILIIQRKSHVGTGVSFSRSVFSRILEPFDFLKAKNLINYQVILEDDVDLKMLNSDIIIFSKHVSDISVKIAERAKALNIKTIYDLDDSILDFPEYSAGNINNQKKINFSLHMEMADCVTIATQRLQQVMKKYLDRETILIANGFNVERHYKSHDENYCPVKLIYTNADKVKLNLFHDGFFNTMNLFLNKNKHIDLNIFSDYEDEIMNFNRYQFLGSVDWFEHKKLLAENNYYMGIVPLGASEDEKELEFNSCKSPIKYLEYGGLKIAGIYSKNPIYTEVIEDRYNGLLVENTAEAWGEALDEMLNNKVLHKKITENAFNDVRENHHVSKAAKQWIAVFQS